MNTIAMIIGYSVMVLGVVSAIAYFILYAYAKHMGMPD